MLVSSHSDLWACERQEVNFLQHSWARVIEMTESERDKENGKCFHKRF